MSSALSAIGSLTPVTRRPPSPRHDTSSIIAESGSDEADVDCAVRLSVEVADLVRGLAERDDDHPVTLWIITRGVREGSSDAAVRQSCLWGTAGVIRAEQPQLWGGLVDLPDGADIAGSGIGAVHGPADTGQVHPGAARRRIPRAGPGAGLRRTGPRAAAVPPGCGIPDHRRYGCARSADGRLARRSRRASSDTGRPHAAATTARLGQRHHRRRHAGRRSPPSGRWNCAGSRSMPWRSTSVRATRCRRFWPSGTPMEPRRYAVSSTPPESPTPNS